MQKLSYHRRKAKKLGHDGISKSVGARSVLVVRVSGSESGQEPSFDAQTISRRVFGGYDDKLNLKDGYAACSGNKLIIEKATGFDQIVDGVLDVNLDISTTGKRAQELEIEVTKAAVEKLGTHVLLESTFDFVMMCLPPGSDLNTAYAYTGWKRSVYNDHWCMYPSSQMHEIGHNLGLKHSSANGIQYNDNSDLMGSSYDTYHEHPKMCFNGAKSWVLGWYNDKSVSIDMDSNDMDGWQGNLIGVSDYLDNSSNDNVVVAEIVTSDYLDDNNIDNYYLIYNRREGINSEVTEFPDTVTVTKGHFRSVSSGLEEKDVSEHMGNLSVGDSYTITNYKNSGVDLIIKFCESVEHSVNPSYAKMNIYLSHGIDPCPKPIISSPTTVPTLPQSNSCLKKLLKTFRNLRI